MQFTPFQKHCSDELLLAYLDQELSSHDSLAVEQHLGACWRCRGRMGELERQAHNTVKAYANWEPLGPDRVAAAEQRFKNWARDYEASRQPVLRVTRPPVRKPWLPFAVAGIAAVLAVVALVLPSRTALPPLPEVINMARQVEAEGQSSDTLVQQEFTVEVSTSGSERSMRRGRLSVFADTRTGRLAARLHDAGGELAMGVWRPSRTEEYLYNSGTHARASRVEPSTRETLTFAQLASHIPEDQSSFQSEFMDWLRGHRWRPVSLMSNLLVFAGQEGVILTAERGVSANEEPVIRLRALRTTADLSAELVVELDESSYRPRLQSLRLKKGPEVVEIRMAPERVAFVPVASVNASTFLPNVPFGLPARASRRSRPVTEPAPMPLAVAAAARPTSAQLESLELQIRFALHRLHSCLGEPVEIVRQTNGVRVEGLVNNAYRKQQLVAALARLDDGDFISVEIQSVDEAPADLASPEVAYPNPPPVKVLTVKSPMQAALERYYRASDDGTAPDASVQAFRTTNRVIELSSELRDESWAMHRLALRYPAEKVAGLPLRDRTLLQEILNDHTARIRVIGATLRDELGPVFSFLGVEPVVTDLSPHVPGPWSAAGNSIHQTILESHRHAMVLFGGDQVSGGAPDSIQGNAEDSTGRFFGALVSLGSSLSNLETQIVRDFFTGKGLVSESPLPATRGRKAEARKGFPSH